MSTTVWYRIGYLCIALASYRYKFYFAWYMSEAGCVASGLGLSSVKRDKNSNKITSITWDRVNNVSVIHVELSQSLPEITNNWNKGVNNWLKNYIYFRIEVPVFLRSVIHPKTFSNIITKLVAAIWHGYYSGYYAFFLSAWIINEANSVSSNWIRPFFLKNSSSSKTDKNTGESLSSGEQADKPLSPRNVTKTTGVVEKNKSKTAKDDGTGSGSSNSGSGGEEVVELPGNYPLKYLYDFMGWLCLHLCMDYLGVSFTLLRMTWTNDVWASVYYYGHIVPALYVLFYMTIGKRLCRVKREKPKAVKVA